MQGTLHLLGTGAAVSDPHRTTTMLAFSIGKRTLLVDCGGDVMQRAQAVGIAYEHIEALFLTHAHPDHISGFPLFMERIWLAGRRHPLPIYGAAPALEHAKKLFEVFDTSNWEGMPEMQWQPVEDHVLDDDDWNITAAWVQHSIPTLGLRVLNKHTGGIVGYSCDTSPCEAATNLGRNADLFVHEATGDYPGHTSAKDAARAAADANAKRLVLVHLPPESHRDDLGEALKLFPATSWGGEGESFRF